MKRRPRRTSAATLTALVLLAAAVLAVVVSVQVLLGEPPLLDYPAIAGALHATPWSDVAVLVAGAAAAAVGLLLVLVAVLPGRPIVLPLRDTGERVSTGASRRSLRTTLRTAASTVDGVSAASLRLRRRAVAVTVTTNRTNTTGLREAVDSAVRGRLTQIGLAAEPAVTVAVRAPRSAP